MSNRHSPTRSRLPGLPALRFGLLAVVVALVAGVLVVRDSPGDNTTAADSDPRVFAGKFFMTGFNALSGHDSVDVVLGLYGPSCREGEAGDQLREQIELAQTYEPHKALRIDGVDFGPELGVTATDNGYVVTLPASKDVRLRINGEWVNAHDELIARELEAPDEGDQPGQLALEYVDGKLRVGPC